MMLTTLGLHQGEWWGLNEAENKQNHTELLL